MSGVWLVSYLILWSLVFVLILVSLALARQVGLIHRRFPPPPARATLDGPAVGSPMEALTIHAADGQAVTFGGPSRRQRLFVFVGAGCSACEELAPSLYSLAKSDGRTTDLVLVSLAGDEQENRQFVKRHRLQSVPFVLAPQAAEFYRVAGTPYALLVDEAGIVQAKGIVNHMDHLESVLASMSDRPDRAPNN